MRKTFATTTAILVIGLVFIFAAEVATAQQPYWAYGQTGAAPPTPPTPPPAAAPPANPAPPNTTPIRVPGSSAEFIRSQITDQFGPGADWFPNDHPAMPPVVATGRRPDVRRCTFCHYYTGQGRPENAGVSGLPVAYFIQTMNDYKNGLRKSAEPRKANTNTMVDIAKGMTDEEIKQSAEYFASLKWTPWVKVVETATIPKMRIGGVFLPVEGTEKEPIGNRLVETPESPEGFQNFNPRTGFISYVPPGSIKKGEDLATKANNKTTQCAVCHGPGLKGVGPVPAIAGRSPSYMARQLYDMKMGARKGVWTPLMMPAVANLTDEDMLNIVAYVGSLAP